MVASLQRGDHGAVLRAADMALEAAADDLALRARVHTWLAQAWERAGDLDRARDHIRLAIRDAKEVGDPAGLDAIRGLRRRVLARLRQAGQQTDPAAPPAPALPEPAGDPLADPALGKALQALRGGDPDAALRHAIAAREAARQSADPKAEVLALLAMARVPGHAEAALRSAHDVADHAGNEGLVSAVVRAAEELKVDLGRRVF